MLLPCVRTTPQRQLCCTVLAVAGTVLQAWACALISSQAKKSLLVSTSLRTALPHTGDGTAEPVMCGQPLPCSLACTSLCCHGRCSDSRGGLTALTVTQRARCSSGLGLLFKLVWLLLLLLLRWLAL